MMKRKRKQHEINYNDDIKEIMVCKYCLYETENIDDLDQHIMVHEAAGDDLEEQCEDLLIMVEDDTVKKKRQRRAKNANQNQMYKCPQCFYVTKRKHDLPKHLLTHSTLETTTVYRCYQCSYETKRKNDMPKHMLAHCTDVQMFKCPECPYQTKRKSDLPKHLLCHKQSSEVPMYKCDFCDYVTKRKGDLPKHVLNHKDPTNVQFFGCSICDYRTKRKNDLHKHMLVHCDRDITGVFKCRKCPYATDKVISFSRHALSNCKFTEKGVLSEHLMLEDILQNVEDCSVDNPDEVDNVEAEYIEIEGEQIYLEDFIEANRVQVKVEPSDQPVELVKKKGLFKIGIGEFSMDMDNN